jgi:hypothetical protein
LRVGVLDASGRSGSVDHAFVADLPAAGPVRTSGLLVWPAQAGAARPCLDFSTGEPLSASVEIYAIDAAAARSAAVKFVLENLSDPAVQRTFSNAARQTDGGIQRVVASIDPSGLPPGEYLVRAEVSAGGPAVAATQHIVLHGGASSPSLTESGGTEAVVDATTAASETPPYRSADLPPSVVRAGTYVERYFRELTNIVMDENYQQQLRSPSTHTGSRLELRRLHSEVLLVTLPAPAGPTAFRDVLTVDGRAVRNRDDRLRRLFLEEQESALRQAAAITRESARYNLGAGRTVNAPTVPLLLARSDHARRVQWTPRGEHVVAGQRLERVRFREIQSPTLIRTAEGNEVFSEGEFWIHPENGTVWRVELAFVVRDRTRMNTPHFRGELNVTFRPHEQWGLLVPDVMNERYSLATDQESTGRAEYTNFRRFTIETREDIPFP